MALPMAAQAQAVDPPAASSSAQPDQDGAIADRAAQTLRCQTANDADLAIGGCTALIQSGRLSDSELASIFARRAQLFAQQNNNEKALQDLEQSLLLEPGTAGTYALRGTLMQALDMRADAIESFRQCLDRDPDNATCTSNMAQLQDNAKKENDACSAEGDPDAVIDSCNLLIQRSPNVARYYNARGVAYFNRKDFTRALQDFSAAIRLAPQNTVMLTNRCNAYIRTRQFDRAIDDCNDALRAKRDNAQALYARGIAKFSRDDAEGAIADFNAALNYSPPSREPILGYRGAAYLKKGDFRAAENDLKDALALNPDSAGAHAYLGGLYLEQNQPDDAIKEANIALGLNPSLSVALIYRGRAYIKKRQTARGMRDIDEAVKLEPDNALVFQARGRIYVSLGQAAKAAADFKACRVLDPFAACVDAKPAIPEPASAQSFAIPQPKPAPPGMPVSQPAQAGAQKPGP